MSEADSVPQIGQVVRIIRGREAGQYAVVLKNLDNRYVMLADGDKRKYDRPKRKNLNHVALMDYTSLEIQSSLLETGRVTNGKLRFTVAKFINEVVGDFEEGRPNDGKRRSN